MEITDPFLKKPFHVSGIARWISPEAMGIEFYDFNKKTLSDIITRETARTHPISDSGPNQVRLKRHIK